MASSEINDEKKWSAFLDKLSSETEQGHIKWRCLERDSRDDAVGPVFFAEILKGRYVVAYRYTYRYHRDEDEFEDFEDVAVELADEHGRPLWRLPSVRDRYELIDIIEFKNSGAEEIFSEFLGQGV